MCIIIAKNKGVELPTMETLHRCWLHNPHGAGYCLVENNKVKIVKGFMKWSDFERSINELKQKYDLKEKAMILHFRISTSGLVDGGNCHPFPISDSFNILRKKVWNAQDSNEIAIAHNGIIQQYSYRNSIDKKLNDTQQFIKNTLYPLYEINKQFYRNPKILTMLNQLVNYDNHCSKFAILDSEERLYLIGNFIEDKGDYFSNNSYSFSHTSFKFTSCKKNNDKTIFEESLSRSKYIEDYEDDIPSLTIIDDDDEIWIRNSFVPIRNSKNYEYGIDDTTTDVYEIDRLTGTVSYVGELDLL